MKIPQNIAQQYFYELIKQAEAVKTSNLFLHRGKCPLCKDYKKRMYIREYPDMFLVYCHNCGYSKPLENFLKVNYPEKYKELQPLILKSISDGSIFSKKRIKYKEIKLDEADIDLKLRKYMHKFSFNINMKQETVSLEKYRQFCLNYLKNRRILESDYSDFICIYSGPLKGYIGIPFFDDSKNHFIHIQGRLVLPNKSLKQEKYMFLRDVDNGIELESKPIWGNWRVNKQETVIICEGTLDACAFKNGISTCGASLSQSFIKNVAKQYPKRTWCVDSFWKDKAGKDLTNRLLDMGEDCLIIPQEIENCKDANDLIKNVFTTNDYIPNDFIETNTYNKFKMVQLLIKS